MTALKCFDTTKAFQDYTIFFLANITFRLSQLRIAVSTLFCILVLFVSFTSFAKMVRREPTIGAKVYAAGIATYAELAHMYSCFRTKRLAHVIFLIVINSTFGYLHECSTWALPHIRIRFNQPFDILCFDFFYLLRCQVLFKF